MEHLGLTNGDRFTCDRVGDADDPAGEVEYLELTLAEVRDGWLKGDYTTSGYLSLLIRSLSNEDGFLKVENVSEFCTRWQIPCKRFDRAEADLIRNDRLQVIESEDNRNTRFYQLGGRSDG